MFNSLPVCGRLSEHFLHTQVESVVLKRCGRDAYRMFRLLAKEGRLLETNKVVTILNFILTSVPLVRNYLINQDPRSLAATMSTLLWLHDKNMHINYLLL